MNLSFALPQKKKQPNYWLNSMTRPLTTMPNSPAILHTSFQDIIISSLNALLFNIILWSSSMLVKVSGRGPQHFIYSGSPLKVNIITFLLLISAYHRPCSCIVRFFISTQYYIHANISILWENKYYDHHDGFFGRYQFLHLEDSYISWYRRLYRTPPCWFFKYLL